MCARCKGEHCAYLDLLRPLPIPYQAWHEVSINFIEGLLKSKRKNAIPEMVCRLTKLAYFLPLSHPFSVATVAHLVMDNICKLHRIPRVIVSEREKIFTNLFWQELFKFLGMKLAFGTAYHPQSDGQTGRVNQCLENYLRCMAHLKPNS